MKAYEILSFEPVNSVDAEKVNEIYNSIIKNGWTGCPILVWGNILLTGSHRLAALNKMADDGMDLDFDCAEDVTDIIEQRIDEGMEQSDIFNNLDCLKEIFSGTWVEQYADEIDEW